MDRRGYLTKESKRFLKSGVVFRPLKLAIFGMRPEELDERKHYIVTGQQHLIRPDSAQSNRSTSSSKLNVVK